MGRSSRLQLKVRHSFNLSLSRCDDHFGRIIITKRALSSLKVLKEYYALFFERKSPGDGSVSTIDVHG